MNKTLKTLFIFVGAYLFSTQLMAYETSCRTDLVGRRGRIIQTFVGYSHSGITQRACRRAERQCESFRQMRRRINPYASCVTRRGDGRRRVRRVTRTCKYGLFGGHRRRRLLSTFTGTARGRRGTGVLEQACRQALRSCLVQRRGRQSCERM